MDDWMPLIVAAVAGASAVGAAALSSRGESAALRHLKAMNEVLRDLPEGAHETELFRATRDRRVAQFATRRGHATWWMPTLWLLTIAIIGAIVVSLIVVSPPGLGSSPIVDTLAIIGASLVGTLLYYIITNRIPVADWILRRAESREKREAGRRY